MNSSPDARCACYRKRINGDTSSKAEWKAHGYENGDTQRFWFGLLRKVLGVTDPERFIIFENPVEPEHTNFIYARIPETKIRIGQKLLNVNLDVKQKQSDGAVSTPMEQTRRCVPGAEPFRASALHRRMQLCDISNIRHRDAADGNPTAFRPPDGILSPEISDRHRKRPSQTRNKHPVAFQQKFRNDSGEIHLTA